MAYDQVAPWRSLPNVVRSACSGLAPLPGIVGLAAPAAPARPGDADRGLATRVAEDTARNQQRFATDSVIHATATVKAGQEIATQVAVRVEGTVAARPTSTLIPTNSPPKLQINLLMTGWSTSLPVQTRGKPSVPRSLGDLADPRTKAFQRRQQPYPPGYVFPVPFGGWRSLLGSSFAH
jgi:hypothetical protein